MAAEEFPVEKVREADKAEADEGSVAAERTAEATESVAAGLTPEERAARENYLRMWPLDDHERR